jgi:hypothetical protein
MIKLLEKMFGRNKKKAIKKEQEMSKKEKKVFLDNDFIERMIRVEQRVASSLSEHRPYNKTEYYKSLHPKERAGFDKYLKLGNKGKYLALFLFAVFFSLPLIVKTSLTGNVIGQNGLPYFEIAFIFMFLLIFFSFLLVQHSKKHKHRKHFKIIDEIGLNRYLAD